MRHIFAIASIMRAWYCAPANSSAQHYQINSANISIYMVQTIKKTGVIALAAIVLGITSISLPLIASAHGVGSTLNFSASPAADSVTLSWTSTSDTSNPSVDQHNLTLWYCSGAGCDLSSGTEIYSYTSTNFTTDTTGLSSGTIYSGSFVQTGLSSGTYSYKIREKHGGSTIEQTVTDVVISPTNNAPVAVDDSYATNENAATTTGNVLTNDTDADADTLTVSTADAVSVNGGTVVNNGNGTFTYTPATGFTGSDTFNYTVSDSTDTDTGTVTITVANLPDCSDGVDNDDDSMTDMDDEGCTDPSDNSETDTPGAPVLTLVKHSTGGNGTFEFTLSGDTSDTASLTTVDGWATTTIELTAGTTSVVETAQSGWNFSSVACVYENASIGVAVVLGEEITVDAGDEVTCTFTNAKVVVEGSGADLSIEKTAESGTPMQGSTYSYTLTVTNNGPEDATNIVVTDTLPSSLSFDAVGSDSACSESSDVVTCTAASLANGASMSFVISVNMVSNAEGTIENTATVSSDESDENDSNDSDTVTVTIETDRKHGHSGGGSSGGSVLGAATSDLPEGCSALLTTFMRYGNPANQVLEVLKLQNFLNQTMNAGLILNGVYDMPTEKAVRAFQTAHADQILVPWGLTAPTGLVYLTTQRWINLMYCESLNIPMPALVPWTGR